MTMSGMAGADGMDHGWGEGDAGWQQAEARNPDLTPPSPSPHRPVVAQCPSTLASPRKTAVVG
jgi:hypothetical protein